MKFHLRCIFDGNRFELWQTPTEVTLMCLTTDDGVLNRSLTGKKARAALARYMRWVKSHDGVLAEPHIKELQSALSKARRVCVYAFES